MKQNNYYHWIEIEYLRIVKIREKFIEIASRSIVATSNIFHKCELFSPWLLPHPCVLYFILLHYTYYRIKVTICTMLYFIILFESIVRYNSNWIISDIIEKPIYSLTKISGETSSCTRSGASESSMYHRRAVLRDAVEAAFREHRWLIVAARSSALSFRNRKHERNPLKFAVSIRGSSGANVYPKPPYVP